MSHVYDRMSRFKWAIKQCKLHTVLNIWYENKRSKSVDDSLFLLEIYLLFVPLTMSRLPIMGSMSLWVKVISLYIQVFLTFNFVST